MTTEPKVPYGSAENLGQPVAAPSRSIEWYAPGESRVFEIDGVQIVVRFVERRGRRGRIAVVTSTKNNDA